MLFVLLMKVVVCCVAGTTWEYSQRMQKGRVMLSTWKSAQSKRLPDYHFFLLSKVRESVICLVLSTALWYSGFYDGQDTLRYESGHTNSPTRLEQTIFIILASLAGLAFLVVISLLLCKFQCQVATVSEWITNTSLLDFDYSNKNFKLFYYVASLVATRQF